ncbi:MAG: MFS transporter [Acidobacteriota bacterium]|nr:MFS transporter [Acidobacteriota bacterium]
MKKRTRIRWNLLALLFAISVVTYLDRINIAVAGQLMSETFGLTDLEFGTIFSAFVVGYVLSQVPAGWIGDRLGHKSTLVLGLIIWSFFTLLTPWAGRGFLVPLVGLVPAIWIVRFLIGCGEAASYPCSNALVGRWFPSRERGLATGTIFAGLGLGATITPPFIAWLMVSFGWETSFYVCGAIGLVLSLVLVLHLTERPEEHSQISDVELQHILTGRENLTRRSRGTPWRQILSDLNVWLLFISYMCTGYTVYLYFSWFYRYLISVRGLEIVQGSLLGALPFLVMTISSPLGGWLSDRLSLRLGKTTARRLIVMCAKLPCLPLLYLGASTEDNYMAVFWFSLAFGLSFLGANCYWTTAIELLPAHAGTVSACMTMGVNAAGIFAPVLTPLIKDQYGWTVAWSVGGAFTVIGGLLWIFVRPEKKIGEVANG